MSGPVLANVFLAWLALLAPRDGQDAGPARELYAHGDCAAALEACLIGLEREPVGLEWLELAGRILRDPRHVTSSTSERAWRVLAQHPSLTRASLVSPGEPGEPLVVTGVVRDADGHPLAGAHLHLFQTDATGQYTPAKPMDEPHARLFAYVVTAADGRFELTTIRPGGYPGTPERKGLEWRIPSHIHFEVAHEGYAERRFQLVFDDDPRMQPEYWREWAKKGGHPVVKVARDAANVAHADLEIVLAKS